MTFARRVALVCLAALCAVAAQAQEAPIPEKRAVYENDIDFYGGDLRAIFDTTLNDCRAACAAEQGCAAFTYNTRAAACFLKTGVERRDTFEGALSALMLPAGPEAIDRAAARAAELDFLDQQEIAAARALAEDLALRYRGSGDAAAALGAAREALGNGAPARARELAGRAVALADRADTWIAFAEMTGAVKTNDGATLRQLQREAVRGAINGYLRADSTPLRLAALSELATALEAADQGRTAIDVLRLAVEIQPRDDLAVALDWLIGLYGFRITETQVDSDAPSPRVCVTLSEPLVAGAVDYADYVQLPPGDHSVTASENQLCIDGAAHGTRFAFTLRPGLPAQSGESLRQPIEQSFYIRDRAPSVRFPGRAYVLPRSAGASVPIVGVNVREAEISIHRLPDEGLRGALREGLVGSQLRDWEKDRIAGELGEAVWTGTAELDSRLNEDVTTALPVGEAVSRFEPGIYVMTARLPGAEPWDAAATQWFIVTDLGVSAISAADGTHAVVRHLGSAASVEGAVLTLVARSGEVLGRAVTDASGYAVFAPGLARGTGGAAPALLTAETPGGDYAYLDLAESGLDLTDRGVDGRAAPPPVDVFLTTDRGAYRPGETVFATMLARDSESRAIEGLPLTAVVLRPDGVEFSRVVVQDAGAGGRSHAVPLPRAAARGLWSLRVFADPAAAPLAQTIFLVEDFVPERIDYDARFAEAAVTLGTETAIFIDARFLYGAPGAGLGIDGEVRITPAEGLEGWPGYRFGPEDSYFETLYEPVPGGLVTGPDGSARVPLFLPLAEVADRPLQVSATLRLTDSSGRPVERSITVPVVPDEPLIGIRPAFEGVVQEGGNARFEVISLSPGGARSALSDLRWELSRVRTDYQWYEMNGRWNWEPVTTRTRVADGTLATLSDAAVAIEAGVDWGRYELAVATRTGGYARTTVSFSAGWYGAEAGSDTPDLLEISLDAERYAPGETATLRVEPRAPGEIEIAVLSDRLIARQTVTATDEGPIEVALPVTEDWGPGAYVLATHIRPLDVAAGRNPSRAIGTAWVGIDPGLRALDARIVSPAAAEPRQTFMAELAVAGASPGETVYASLAATDLGILNLTGFEPPDALGHYLGQRRLGVELRDVYGRLIDGLAGTPGRLRQGGDGGAAGTEGPPPTEALMAVFSGVVTLDAQGRARIPVTLPDFNGTVRLAAVVWSASGVGQATQDLLVRDPVVLQANMPRFLAPGDVATLEMDLAHITGPAGPVEVSLTSSPLMGLPERPLTATIAASGRVTLAAQLLPQIVGDHRITARLTTPDGQVLTKSLTLGVRANNPEIARQSRIDLATAGQLALTPDLFAGLVPGSGRVTVAAGPLARFDVPGLLTALDTYPYGCTEQITSRAMPLLYYSDLASRVLASTPGRDAVTLGAELIRERLEDAITSVLSRQSRNGGFGLWDANDWGDLWLEAYVTDFLSRARAQGFEVPDIAFRAALDNLRNRVNAAPDFENGGEGLAYALVVLAREGAASVGDLRYYADTKAQDFATPMALAQLGAALSFYGDPGRADALFRAAAARFDTAPDDASAWRADYGSDLRDRAAVLTLAVEAGSTMLDREGLAARIARAAGPGQQTSTQEQLWTVLAAHALGANAAPAGLTVDGIPAKGAFARSYLEGELASGVTLGNEGATGLPVVVSVFGTPSTPEPAQGNGYRIARELFTLDGAIADPAAIVRNDRLVVRLTVTPERPSEARLIVDDPLPAGFEIENPRLGSSSGEVAGLEWLSVGDVARATAAQTDRFTAAVDWSGTNPFQLAYIVRAISPGTFHHPAASVEDMYRPAYRARTDAGRVSIAAR